MQFSDSDILDKLVQLGTENRELKAQVSEQQEWLANHQRALVDERAENLALKAVNADLKGCLTEACEALRLCCDKIESLEASLKLETEAKRLSFN